MAIDWRKLSITERLRVLRKAKPPEPGPIAICRRDRR